MIPWDEIKAAIDRHIVASEELVEACDSEEEAVFQVLAAFTTGGYTLDPLLTLATLTSLAWRLHRADQERSLAE